MQGYRTGVRATKSHAQRADHGLSAARSVAVSGPVSVGWRVQPVPRRDVVHPLRRSIGQPIFVREFAELGQLVQGRGDWVVRMLDQQLTEFAEVVLETARRDDLDDAAGFAPGVPHRMHLPARLGDVATGTEDHFTVVGPEADLAGEHDRMLILTGVPVRRGEQADLERMLDDGHLPAVGLAGQLEHLPENGQRGIIAYTGLS